MSVPEKKQNLEREIAQTIVAAMLSVSPRLDTFSTWLMGITTGALVLIYSTIDKVIAILKAASTKTLIAFLAISTLFGLLQKYNSLQLQIKLAMKEAADQKICELASAHAGEQVTNPYEYFRQHADISQMLVLLVSAFPKLVQRKIVKMIVCDRPVDLRDLQGDIKRLLWQHVFISAQLLCALATVLIMLFSL